MTTTPDPSPASSERLRIVVPNVTLHSTNELWEFAQALLALAQDLDRQVAEAKAQTLEGRAVRELETILANSDELIKSISASPEAVQ